MAPTKMPKYYASFTFSAIISCSLNVHLRFLRLMFHDSAIVRARVTKQFTLLEVPVFLLLQNQISNVFLHLQLSIIARMAGYQWVQGIYCQGCWKLLFVFLNLFTSVIFKGSYNTLLNFEL